MVQVSISYIIRKKIHLLYSQSINNFKKLTMIRKCLFFCWWITIAKSKKLLLLLMSVIFLFTTSCQKDEFIPFDDGILKSATVTASTVIWGPKQVFAGKTGLSETITCPTDYENCYTLTLQNGDGSGLNTVSGVTVKIDGITIISSTDIRKKTSVIRQICDKTSFTITVNAKGKSTNYVSISIEGWELPPAVFTDKTGKEYKTVKIGTLTWMAENLAYLPSVNSPSEDSYTDQRFYVYNYYGNDVSAAKAELNYQTYGVLYNQPAALASCPEGWRLPTKEDWEYIGKLLSTTYTSAENNDAGTAMKSISGWDVLISDGKNGTNSSGFDGRPAGTAVGGSAAGGYGYFQEINYRGVWWTSSTYTFNSETWCYQASLYSFDEVLKVAAGPFLNFGQSVRYVKGTLPTN